MNNVGTNLDYPDDLDRVPEDKLWDVIHINIAAATMLTRIVLPGMKQRRQGAIVNISSGSELQPLPYMTTYAASKVWERTALGRNWTKARWGKGHKSHIGAS